MKLRALILTVAMAAFMVAPAITQAAAPDDFFPIVRCNTTDNPVPCTPCGLFEAVDNVINLIFFGITGPLAVFLIILSGGMFVVGAGTPAMITQARSMLTRTLLGVTIILLSWIATTLLLKTVAGAAPAGTPWYEFSCPEFLTKSQGTDNPLGPPAASKGSAENPNTELVEAYKKACNLTDLAQQHGLPYTEVNRESQQLDIMMRCIEQDPVVKALIDTSQRYTWERKNPLCNLTRGESICGPHCQHEVHSCHYGGATGIDGAEAVDYNGIRGKTVTYIKGTTSATRIVVSSDPKSSRCLKPDTLEDNGLCRTVRGSNERDLFNEINRSIQMNHCAYKFLNFENDHTHVSTQSCSNDGKGINPHSDTTIPLL